MRVAHLTATYPPYRGGAGTVAQNLARGLVARGHEVEVRTAGGAGAASEDGVVVRRLRPRLAIGNAPLLPGLTKLDGFDIVHLHYPFMFGAEALLAARVGRRRRAPLVVSYHNMLVGEGARAPIFRGYEATVGRALARRADRICVVSQEHAATVPYLRPSQVVELPNGVDLEAFAPGDGAAERERLGLPPDAVVALYVATLDRAHYLKRPDLAIDALAGASDDRLHLVMVGGGEAEADLRARAAAAGVGERVHFAGEADHARLPSLLRAGDLFLLTSDLESFGIVLIEAMACGLPVIASDLPGIRAVVSDGEHGDLVPPGNAAGFAAALDRIAALPPAERAALGAAGRARAEANYGWPGIVERLEGIYTEAL
jgi:glycosyltransferase involved in cell wall biosynthesis